MNRKKYMVKLCLGEEKGGEGGNYASLDHFYHSINCSTANE